MDNQSYSVLDINGAEIAGYKGKGKNAKQHTWVLLLKAHRAVSRVTWLGASLCTLFTSIKKRLLLRQDFSNSPEKGRLLFKFLRVFIVLAMLMLLLESIAFWKGWHFQELHLHLAGSLNIPKSTEIMGWLYNAYLSWLSFRALYIAYPIQVLSKICIILYAIQSLDKIILCLGCFWIKYKKMKPSIEGDPFQDGDVEGSASVYPMVLVQIPMCNEREVYEQSISAVCQLDWPRNRFKVQVLDDSDDETVMLLIKAEVLKWKQQGANIVYLHRQIRTGYKAGNLRAGMNCDYVKDYEFVTIFDADFTPNSDFLKRTIPHFKGKPELGLVQARWSFVNKDGNLLTRLQNINLCFHFEVEQQVGGIYLNFFGFNGTAGVWRIKALQDSGGWLDRTTVEDMDIAVRAHLNGWKFIFLNDVKVNCELPESFEAYRKQQHRWHSGPMHLFRICIPAIINSKISIWKKANLVLLFFLLRKLVLPFYSFTLFCVILPFTVFVPEAELPIWVICYIPVLICLLNVLPSLRSFPFLVPYLLFENSMSVTKFNAMVVGLFKLKSSYQWVVTKKAGRTYESDTSAIAELETQPQQQQKLLELKILKGQDAAAAAAAAPAKKRNRIYKQELALALLLLTAALRSLLSAQGLHFYFLLFQGVSFLIIGLDLIGEQMS